MQLPIARDGDAMVPEVVSNDDGNALLTTVLEGGEKNVDKTNPKLNELMDLLDELGDAPCVILYCICWWNECKTT
jgi:hypothetical protein